MVCEQDQKVEGVGKLDVEKDGPRGGGDASDYIDSLDFWEEGHPSRSDGAAVGLSPGREAAERIAAVWQWQLAASKQLALELREVQGERL